MLQIVHGPLFSVERGVVHVPSLSTAGLHDTPPTGPHRQREGYHIRLVFLEEETVISTHSLPKRWHKDEKLLPSNNSSSLATTCSSLATHAVGKQAPANMVLGYQQPHKKEMNTVHNMSLQLELALARSDFTGISHYFTLQHLHTYI